MKRIVLLLFILGTSSQLYSAETRYIRDELYVPLRSGQTTQHRIVHKGLVSGTALTILNMSDDETYSFVRTSKGIEGWIQTQYLSDSPAGRDLARIANRKLADLQQRYNKLNEQLKQLSSEQKNAKEQFSTLSSNNSETTKELDRIRAISANAIQLNEDNQRLLEESQMLKKELVIANTDNQRLTDNEENDAFLNGALAVLLGVMITLIVPRAWPKKSTEWA
ncbi:MAG: TIGR04211 family SH3 domain-containing protein [Oceanicoccus sp.]